MRYTILAAALGAVLWTAGCGSTDTTAAVTTTSEGQLTEATAASSAAYHDTALIRFFNADPHREKATVASQKQPLFDNIAFKTITPYMEVPRGVSQFTLQAGGVDKLGSSRRELFPGRHYTLIALPGKKGGERLESLSDNLGKIDPGEARVRLINATTDVNDLDVYIQGTDTPVLHGSGSGDVVAFAEMYAATVEIRPGKKSAAKPFLNLTVEPGRLYTFVVVNDGSALDVVQIIDHLEP